MIRFYLIPVGVFIIDWITKALVRSGMPLGEEIPLLPFFSVVHVQNTGMAFGLFPGKNLFFIFFGILLVGFMGFTIYQFRQKDKCAAYCLAFVLGGAMGNIFDRIRFGSVTDFLDFYIGSHHWPAFNVADSAISIGAVYLLIHTFINPQNQQQHSP